MPSPQYPRLLHVLPAFLIIVSSLLIILTHSFKPPTSPTVSWPTYSDPHGFSFTYPPTLTISQDATSTTISHSLPFIHPNPCNFAGLTQENIPELIDFHVTFSLENHPLIDTIIDQHGVPWFMANHVIDSSLQISPGFIDPVTIGSLSGYKITQGVEGCGNYTYYFSLGTSRTLVVIREMIPQFSGAVADVDTYLALPGVIKPDQEDYLFARILSTFKFTP